MMAAMIAPLCSSRACLLTALLLLAAVPALASIDRGIAYIGSTTFERFVDGRHHVLILFDKHHNWGAGWDHIFEEFALKV
jgi:hypothetical protein